MKFDAQRKAFVDEYLIDFNATQAAIRAGYSPNNANSTGSKLIRNPEIREELDKRLRDRIKRTEITADLVLTELLAIATADPKHLIEQVRRCCRHCWGKDFGYQRTIGELNRERTAHQDREAKVLLGESTEQVPPFDEQGGGGFDKTKDPNPDCPECNGEGVEQTIVKDTRDLPPGVRSLYAGVKVTKDGIEVKMHSKEKALELLGRHLALFNDKLDLNVKGDLAQRIIDARKRSSKAQADDGSDLV